MRRKLFILALILYSVTANLRIHESQFEMKDLTEQSFFNDFVANNLRSKNSEKQMMERFSTHQFKSYELFKKSCTDLKEAKYDVLKNLKIEKLAGSQALNKIFETTPEDHQTWHALTHISPKLRMIIVGLFSFDTEEKTVYLHILKKPLEEDNSTQELIGYSFSHFGFKFEKEMENLDSTQKWTPEEKTFLEDELMNAMTKIAATRHVHPYNPHSEFHFREMLKIKEGNLGIPAIVMTYASQAMVKYAVKVYAKVVKFFGVKRKSEYIRTIKREGFSKYHLKATLQRNFGIKGAYLDKYLSYMVGRLTAQKPKHQSEIRASLSMMKYLPDMQWSINDVNVDVSNNSYDKFFGVMYNKEASTNKYNVMVVDCNAYFKLSDNLDVYMESKSSMGGGFSTEQYKIKRVPRQVTQEDIQAMRLFNLMIVVKLYNDDLGGKKVNFPKIQ